MGVVLFELVYEVQSIKLHVVNRTVQLLKDGFDQIDIVDFYDLFKQLVEEVVQQVMACDAVGFLEFVLLIVGSDDKKTVQMEVPVHILPNFFVFFFHVLLLEDQNCGSV